MSKSSDKMYFKGNYQLGVLKKIKKGTRSKFESVLQNTFPNPSEDTVCNRNFRLMIINWSKHKFMED